jgi:hypothetical protein
VLYLLIVKQQEGTAMGGAKKVDGVILSRASTEQLKELRELLVARGDVRGVKQVRGELSRRRNDTYGHSGPGVSDDRAY